MLKFTLFFSIFYNVFSLSMFCLFLITSVEEYTTFTLVAIKLFLRLNLGARGSSRIFGLRSPTSTPNLDLVVGYIHSLLLLQIRGISLFIQKSMVSTQTYLFILLRLETLAVFLFQYLELIHLVLKLFEILLFHVIVNALINVYV